MESLPRTRGEAVKVGSKYYFTGKPCRNGHKERRASSDGKCLACSRERSLRWVSKNRDKTRKQALQWYRDNRDRAIASARRYRAENPDKNRERYRKWSSENQHVKRAIRAKYRASKLQATPAWLTEEDLAEIKRIYAACPEGWHIDHVIPLQGKTVCGLHVPSNLRQVPASVNLSKYNKLPEELT